jgi:hypothetical protein
MHNAGFNASSARLKRTGHLHFAEMNASGKGVLFSHYLTWYFCGATFQLQHSEI